MGSLKYASVEALLIIAFEDDGVTELESQAIDAVDAVISDPAIEMAFMSVKKVGDREEV